MSVAQLLADLAHLGIRIEAHGDRLRFSPRSAVTPELTDRMMDHKSELLSILRGDADLPTVGPIDSGTAGHATDCRPESDTSLTAEFVASLRSSNVDWTESEAREERLAISLEGCGLEPTTQIDPADLIPCSKCKRLDMWETLAGDWRCLQCDPPKRSRSLAKLIERLERRA